ncbi:MAG: hypothetical protein J0H28_00890 [Methylibium petroleiphilum]|nr:hypothetical protein [Methylibium petroleiphilum]
MCDAQKAYAWRLDNREMARSKEGRVDRPNKATYASQAPALPKLSRLASVDRAAVLATADFARYGAELRAALRLLTPRELELVRLDVGLWDQIVFGKVLPERFSLLSTDCEEIE